MKHILFFLFSTGIIIMACSSVQKANSSATAQGINGSVTLATGNRMPMKDAPQRSPRGIKATVLVYEPTNIAQTRRIGTTPVYTAINTKLVASVETDSSGAFIVALPVGSYSLFVKQGDRFYANLFDVNNNIALFTVEEGKLTKVRLSVNNNASY